MLRCFRVVLIDWAVPPQTFIRGRVIDIVNANGVPTRLRDAWEAVVGSGELYGVLGRTWLDVYSAGDKRGCLVAAGDKIEQLLTQVDAAVTEAGLWSIGACSSAGPVCTLPVEPSLYCTPPYAFWVASIPPPCPAPSARVVLAPPSWHLGPFRGPSSRPFVTTAGAWFAMVVVFSGRCLSPHGFRIDRDCRFHYPAAPPPPLHPVPVVCIWTPFLGDCRCRNHSCSW